jgi:hypothetical protein
MMERFPRMMRVRQSFPPTPAFDIRAVIEAEFAKVRGRVRGGAKIAVGVGSRGIANLSAIVAAVLDVLKGAGAAPFIFPAMGSHGGATPEGQRELLAEYGVTESAMGVPIRASMETRLIGTSEDGVPIHASTEALAADGIVLVNRIKPHTDFFGPLGSGLMKMSVIGLGKRDGAAAMHVAASRIGHERAIRGMARVMIAQAPILCGVAILENQHHDTVKLVVVPREEIEAREGGLLAEARELMPRLPFEEIDLLIVDQIGKNISGAGMDPNVTGRWVDGYSSSLMRAGRPAPFIRRVFVRELTPETHGNAIGIGLADVTTSRLVRAMDDRVTYINALTALTPQCAKVPIHFETDREGIGAVLTSLALDDVRRARVVRIRDTLSLSEMEVSEELRGEVEGQAQLSGSSAVRELEFDSEGNLTPMNR